MDVNRQSMQWVTDSRMEEVVMWRLGRSIIVHAEQFQPEVPKS